MKKMINLTIENYCVCSALNCCFLTFSIVQPPINHKNIQLDRCFPKIKEPNSENRNIMVKHFALINIHDSIKGLCRLNVRSSIYW